MEDYHYFLRVWSILIGIILLNVNSFNKILKTWEKSISFFAIRSSKFQFIPISKKEIYELLNGRNFSDIFFKLKLFNPIQILFLHALVQRNLGAK